MNRSPESSPGLSPRLSERGSVRIIRNLPRLGSFQPNASARPSDLLAVVRTSSEIKKPWYSSYSLRFTNREDEVDYLDSQQPSSLIWIALPLLLLGIGRLSYDKSEDFGILCAVVSFSALLVVLETLNRDYLRYFCDYLWVSPRAARQIYCS